MTAIENFVLEKMSGYVAGGSSPETAARFTRGELAAIYKGNHRSRDTSGAWRVTPPPEALAIGAAMAKCDEAIAEIVNCCAGREAAPAMSGAGKKSGLEGLKNYVKKETV